MVVPAGVEDPAHPSGGNVYDRRVCRGLGAAGWEVHRHDVPGAWPFPDPAPGDRLDAALGAVADGEVALVDGLVTVGAGDVVARHARRLRLVLLLHLPVGAAPTGTPPGAVEDERTALTSAAAVVTTSAWTRDWLVRHQALPERRVHVADPGVDPARLAPGTPSGGELLCVAAVTRGKGHDVLVAALGALTALPERCTFVGATDLDPAYVHDLHRLAEEHGVAERLLFTGPLVGPALDEAYAAADLLVLPSRAETYGMVVTEALAHGLPVVATAVGGIPTTLGADEAGERPGLLVPPEDAHALASALRDWLADPSLRCRLRTVARQRRSELDGWSVTVDRVARVLSEVAA